MDIALFFALPVIVAAGTALLCFVLLQARMEVAVARERAVRAATEARLRCLEDSLPERLKMAEDTARLTAMNELTAGLRVEKRQYIQPGGHALVLQERLWLRNTPLSRWVERDLPLAATGGLIPAETESIFLMPETRMLPSPNMLQTSVL